MVPVLQKSVLTTRLLGILEWIAHTLLLTMFHFIQNTKARYRHYTLAGISDWKLVSTHNNNRSLAHIDCFKMVKPSLRFVAFFHALPPPTKGWTCVLLTANLNYAAYRKLNNLDWFYLGLCEYLYLACHQDR